MSTFDNQSKAADYDTSDPEWHQMIRTLKQYRCKDIQNGNFEVLNHDPQKELGLIQYIRTDYTNNILICKFLHFDYWFKTHSKITDLIKHLENLRANFQNFEGFYIKDDREAYLVFEKPKKSIEQYTMEKGVSEKVCNEIFFIVLESLCALECIGIHHPSINTRSVFLVESKVEKVKVSNPFIYDTFIQEFVHVYTNPVTNAYSRKAFNKRKLQENVYNLCLLILALINQSQTESFLIKQTSEYNYAAIMQGLQKIPLTFSEKMRNILYNILTKHIDLTPTPIGLCDHLGLTVPGNSFYKHTPHHYIDFNPFSNTLPKSKIFDDLENKPAPAPDLEALDKTMHSDLQRSKMIGTEYRRKNNFVINCDYYGKTARPYRNNLLV